MAWAQKSSSKRTKKKKGNQVTAEDGVEEDSSHIVSENTEEPLNVSLLPPRLFCTDRYPDKGRINSYSKPESLLDLVGVLEGTQEFEWLKGTCFGRLFKLPVRKSSLSGKLVHQILCRSLVTAKRHEIWFVFGGHPIRFSLREFGIVTGLNCGPFPSEEVVEDEGGDYFHTLIGPNSSYTIQEIVNMLKLDKRLPEEDRMPGNRRIRLALIVIVEGILVCNSSTVRASKKVAKMVKDLDSFVNYPWGRKSFLRTLEMVKVGRIVEDEAALAEKLTQSHTATHGFTLAFQLLFLHAIPQLEAYLPDTSHEQTFTDHSVLHLTMLKTFHNSNILETELDPKLDVENILHSEDDLDVQDFSWGDNEVEDLRVDYMFNKIKEGHIFKKEDWQGGFANLPLITLSLSKSEKAKKGPTAKPTKHKKGALKKTSKRKHKDQSWDDRADVVDGVTAEELLREVDRRNNEHTYKVQQMLSSELSLTQGSEDKMGDSVMNANGSPPPVEAEPQRKKKTLSSNQNCSGNDSTRENENSQDINRKRKREDNLSSVASVEEDKAKETTMVLPFEKTLSTWKTLESMEVFKTVPQSPHFNPLVEVREEYRESLAVGMMFKFSDLLDQVKLLPHKETISSFISISNSLAEFEKHGFNVKVAQSRIDKLLTLRGIQSKKEDELKGAKKVTAEKESAKVESKRKILELQRLNEEMDKEIAESMSCEAKIVQELDDVKLEFQATASAPW